MTATAPPGMASFRMKSVTSRSNDAIPGTALPVIGMSACVTEGETGDFGSPPQESRKARAAIRIVVNAFVRFMETPAGQEQRGEGLHAWACHPRHHRSHIL